MTISSESQSQSEQNVEIGISDCPVPAIEPESAGAASGDAPYMAGPKPPENGHVARDGRDGNSDRWVRYRGQPIAPFSTCGTLGGSVSAVGIVAVLGSGGFRSAMKRGRPVRWRSLRMVPFRMLRKYRYRENEQSCERDLNGPHRFLLMNARMSERAIVRFFSMIQWNFEVAHRHSCTNRFVPARQFSVPGACLPRAVRNKAGTGVRRPAFGLCRKCRRGAPPRVERKPVGHLGHFAANALECSVVVALLESLGNPRGNLRISGSFMPRVVSAGVPTRMPEGLSGGFVSQGMEFLLTVMPALPSASSASEPRMPFSKTSTSRR